MTLGVLVALMPFLGFPGGWKSVFYFMFGASIALLAYMNARPRVSGSSAARAHTAYEQNAPDAQGASEETPSDTQTQPEHV